MHGCHVTSSLDELDREFDGSVTKQVNRLAYRRGGRMHELRHEDVVKADDRQFGRHHDVRLACGLQCPKRDQVVGAEEGSQPTLDAEQLDGLLIAGGEVELRVLDAAHIEPDPMPSDDVAEPSEA